MSNCYKGICGATINIQECEENRCFYCDYGRSMQGDIYSFPDELCMDCNLFDRDIQNHKYYF